MGHFVSCSCLSYHERKEEDEGAERQSKKMFKAPGDLGQNDPFIKAMSDSGRATTLTSLQLGIRKEKTTFEKIDFGEDTLSEDSDNEMPQMLSQYQPTFLPDFSKRGIINFVEKNLKNTERWEPKLQANGV
jgi:hypothetical protein